MTNNNDASANLVCSRCVMDTSANDIHFDINGICNYCLEFEKTYSLKNHFAPKYRQSTLTSFIDSIKFSRQGKKYDCIVGLSGGVDSSWALHKAVELGLKPLAVHMDNGWNSELAQNNISNIVRALDVDLYTYVIEWDEYRKLMEAFFSADVVDIELLYDNAMLAVNFNAAEKNNVKHILTGSNLASEGIRLPRSWNWHKYDFKNIRGIASKLNAVKVKSFPGIGTIGRIKHEIINGRKLIAFLDYFEYNKFEALDELTKKYDYKPYPYKHYESVFTRLYQGYILPIKFKIDKRRMHFSSLIISGQMTRDEALSDLAKIPYQDSLQLQNDIDYFLKKMDWTEEKFKNYLARPRVEHDVYPSERRIYETFQKFYKKYL